MSCSNFKQSSIEKIDNKGGQKEVSYQVENDIFVEYFCEVTRGILNPVVIAQDGWQVGDGEAVDPCEDDDQRCLSRGQHQLVAERIKDSHESVHCNAWQGRNSQKRQFVASLK